MKSLDEILLDHKADRLELRDETRKIKAKAHNLLVEDVLSRLELSLKALNRENPKVLNASHQIELAIESIEKALSTFKE